MTSSTLVPAPVSAGEGGRRRSVQLDALRGAAVLFMVADHVALFVGADPVRMTVGRLAMPLFFVLAGHLSARLSWRLVWVVALGLALPTVAVWIDSPNVLVYLGAGAVVLAVTRRSRLVLWFLVALPLVLLANGFALAPVGTGFHPAALLGLMAVGALLDRRSVEQLAGRLPAAVTRVLARSGRYPLTVYVGHVLLLTLVFGVLGPRT
jgi:uncharacterized membrane protein